MKKNFIAVYSIVCPHCNMKQTGVERVYEMATGKIIEVEDGIQEINYPEEQYAIKCVMDTLNGQPFCGKLITGGDLMDVTRFAVKSPSDFNK